MADGATRYDVAIVGAGIIGVTTAYALSRAGLRTVVLERNAAPARETSYANGGLVTPSMSDPWAAPGLPGKVLGWIGKEDAPFLLRLKALPGAARWGAAFLANCTPARWRENTERVLALSTYSNAQLGEIVAAHELDHIVASRGALRLFSDEASADAAEQTAQFLAERGVRYMRLRPSEVAAIEPALAARAGDLFAGIHFPDDRSGDCRTFAEALTGAAAAEFRYAANVRSIEQTPDNVCITTDTDAIRADRVVLATGMPSGALCARHAHMLAYPVKGYSATLKRSAHAPVTPIIDDRAKIGIAPLGDYIRLVGTAELCGADARVKPARIQALLDGARRLLPDLDDHAGAREDWAGLRPMTPDGAPYIGAITDRLFVNLGHGHLGWTNSCGAAALLRDLLAGAAPAIDPARYAPTRNQSFR